MKAIKKLWDIVSTAVVILVVLFTLLLVGVRLVGFQVYTVLSGSMEPTFPTGSLLYVKEVDPFTLEEGDVITFMVNETTVATHRIVGIVPDETDPDVIRFRTKGDNNDAEDATLVHYKNVIGEPKLCIPELGYVANYIQNPPGTYIVVAGAALFLALMFLPDLFEEEEETEAKPKKRKKKEE